MSSPFRRLLATAALLPLLAACAQTMSTPPEPLTGIWLVEGVYDSGTDSPTAAERHALKHQAMRVSPSQITDPLGRNCPAPSYEVRRTSGAEWFGYGGGWLDRRGPDVALTAVDVLCAGYPFDRYALREDGALVGRYRDAYLVLRRDDDPRMAERLPALDTARYNRVLMPGGPARPAAPQLAAAAPAAAPAAAAGEAGDDDALAVALAVPPPEVLGPLRRPAPEPQAEAAEGRPAAAGGTALHLASLKTEDAAAAEWRGLRQRQPLLRQWQVRYDSVDLPEKGRYVRVLAVPPAGTDARAACAELERAGQYCRLQR
ncbi:hypothetical protein [Caenispirillum bisanense]|uniref:SPOR domain-containing protein n=1 Tax=Caenispirillum bisanense TaxID=414052 RepID=UPI0031E1FBE7